MNRLDFIDAVENNEFEKCYSLIENFCRCDKIIKKYGNVSDENLTNILRKFGKQEGNHYVELSRDDLRDFKYGSRYGVEKNSLYEKTLFREFNNLPRELIDYRKVFGKNLSKVIQYFGLENDNFVFNLIGYKNFPNLGDNKRLKTMVIQNDSYANITKNSVLTFLGEYLRGSEEIANKCIFIPGWTSNLMMEGLGKEFDGNVNRLDYGMSITALPEWMSRHQRDEI